MKTSMAASAERGISSMILVAKSKKMSRKRPWKKLAHCVLPPLFTLAEDLTISLIIGSPPNKAATEELAPMENKSLFKLDFRWYGSRASTALALNKLSMAATKAIVTTADQKTPSPILVKSGAVIPSAPSGILTNSRWSVPKNWDIPMVMIITHIGAGMTFTNFTGILIIPPKRKCC